MLVLSMFCLCFSGKIRPEICATWFWGPRHRHRYTGRGTSATGVCLLICPAGAFSDFLKCVYKNVSFVCVLSMLEEYDKDDTANVDWGPRHRHRFRERGLSVTGVYFFNFPCHSTYLRAKYATYLDGWPGRFLKSAGFSIYLRDCQRKYARTL